MWLRKAHLDRAQQDLPPAVFVSLFFSSVHIISRPQLRPSRCLWAACSVSGRSLVGQSDHICGRSSVKTFRTRPEVRKRAINPAPSPVSLDLTCLSDSDARRSDKNKYEPRELSFSICRGSAAPYTCFYQSILIFLL